MPARTPPPTATQRQKILAEMPRPLRAVAKQVAALLSDEAEEPIVRKWMVGGELQHVIDATDLYGDHGVNLLAKYLGYTTATLYYWVGMRRAFNKADLRRLAKRRMRSGRPISEGHLIVLGNVKSQRTRGKLINRVFRESLTAAELRREIPGHAKVKPGHQDRKPTPPPSPDAILQQMADRCQRFHRQFEAWLGNLEQVEQARPSAKLRDHLVEARDQLKTLKEDIEEVEPRLRRSLRRMGKATP